MAHIWLRNEYKTFEQCSPLIPEHAKLLIQNGHRVTVEKSPYRAFHISLYKEAGCEIAPTRSWQYAPYDAYILGFEFIPEIEHSLDHKHIYFAHSFKNRLYHFKNASEIPYNYEYFFNSNQKRITSFGFYAGVAGTAIALLVWVQRMCGKKPPYNIMGPYFNLEIMIQKLKRLLQSIGYLPSVLMIGKGRAGQGASYLLNSLGISFSTWGRQETSQKNVEEKIFKFNIMLNCIFVDESTKIFFTKDDLIHKNNHLSVISDISCEPGSPFNPIPIYKTLTNFDNPTQRIGNIDLIAIDNLPTYLPVQSSAHFSQQLIKHLQDFLPKNTDYECEQFSYVETLAS